MIDISESENARQLNANGANQTAANVDSKAAIKASRRKPVKQKGETVAQAKAQSCKVCKQQKSAMHFYADELGICRVCWANQLYTSGVAKSA
ncbi:MAG: hypothetical protein HRU21_01550 [Pseudomonadales bacterium]|nr:hypothetical protein [Pseudomonadales bacterium]